MASKASLQSYSIVNGEAVAWSTNGFYTSTPTTSIHLRDTPQRQERKRKLAPPL